MRKDRVRSPSFKLGHNQITDGDAASHSQRAAQLCIAVPCVDCASVSRTELSEMMVEMPIREHIPIPRSHSTEEWMQRWRV